MHKQKATLLAMLCLTLFALPAMAESGHTAFIDGPIDSGPEATRQCLTQECHQGVDTDFMKTTHWTWSLDQKIAGKMEARGKKNTLNNFCVSVRTNEKRCSQCHAGYGYADASFDFSDPTRIDCLVCHDTTGTYKKAAKSAGMPEKNVDLTRVAMSVGMPSRVNCGACHFFGGGGDAVKHGDLDSSMEFPGRDIDVHMDAEGLDFQCQRCHVTNDHQITGNAMAVSPGGLTHASCESCHQAPVHKQSRINAHLDTVACQSCHIPAFAKEVPTKLSWDWSTAGKDLKAEKDRYGKPTFAKKKGSFVWGKNVPPTYAWFNGQGNVYKLGDKMDPGRVTPLAYPVGSKKDDKAKIYPFKTHRGKQIYDTENNIFITPTLFGKKGFWKHFDWDKAARVGMAANGLPYSGEYGFADTIMYWRINHMVAPKEQALSCLDCHDEGGRFDWKQLGYKGDPMTNPKWARTR